ncbi:hypothetical protein [Spiroplasma endosymbiont of Labia minor]|uniref:hypothetical protein n=1 Tax=Spiroplasma endosymbiont of Labia minor TaxID=3066305 RepID=UPI0030D5B1A9
MRIFKNRKIDFVFKESYKIISAALILFAIIWGYIIGFKQTAQNDVFLNNQNGGVIFGGDTFLYTVNFFTYFTIQSNIFVMIFFIIVLILYKYEGKHKWLSFPVVCMVTVYITITGLIYNCLLLPTEGAPTTTSGWVTSMIEHVFAPIAMIIYLLFIMENKKFYTIREMITRHLWRFMSFPILYLFIDMIGWYTKKSSSSNSLWNLDHQLVQSWVSNPTDGNLQLLQNYGFGNDITSVQNWLNNNPSWTNNGACAHYNFLYFSSPNGLFGIYGWIGAVITILIIFGIILGFMSLYTLENKWEIAQKNYVVNDYSLDGENMAENMNDLYTEKESLKKTEKDNKNRKSTKKKE